MIASERSLASTHQSQSQQHRKPTALGKARNGAAKPPVRPVKIYVIDPRKLQQRLEAYNQKRAETEKEKQEKEKSEKSGDDNGKSSLSLSPPSPVQSITANRNHTLAALPSSATKSVPPKVLPTLAPKLQTTIASATKGLNLNSHENPGLGNGLTFQSLQCINAAGLGIPALPLVVTNGVALIQPSISQSSIPASGLFLPGVTAIPSVINSDRTLFSSATQQQSLQKKAKQKLSSAQKRKAKKKKTVRKRKAEEKEKDEEEEERELSYLLKETTTRLGRVSRPVSQPHSPPLVASSLSATSSRAPSPNSKPKKKVFRKEELVLPGEICVQPFLNKEKIKSHFDEFSQRRKVQEREAVSSLSQSSHERHPSTNIDNQGTQHLLSPPISKTTGSIETTATTITQSNIATTAKSLHGYNNRVHLRETAIQHPATASYENLHQNKGGPFSTSVVALDLEYNPRNSLFSGRSNIGKGNNTVCTVSQNACISSPIEIDTGMQASLVPTSERQSELFQRSMSPSNVVHVPSSYSIPSSPTSQCQSPGSPDNIYSGGSLHDKDEASSRLVVCNSPVDPMFLRSVSPFPPPVHEASLHSVGASNLSIPEESLCKGELFMDLGDGVLESSRLSAISPTPFGNESPIDQLFANSRMKGPVHSNPQEEVIHSVVPVMDTSQSRDSTSIKTGHSIVTPMLLETTMEDANDGEIFQTANYARTFLHPSAAISAVTMPSVSSMHSTCQEQILEAKTYPNCPSDLPRTPQSACIESDVSMDSSEPLEPTYQNNQKSRSVWQFVKDQIKFRGISQACGEISEMADKLSRIARDHFIPIREEEVDRLGNNAPIIHVDTPFFSHLLDLPFGMYIFKEDVGTRKKIPPPPPLTSSELSFTGGVEDVEKFLPPDIDLISLPHLTNLDLP